MNEYFIAWWNVENLFDVMKFEERYRKVRNNTGKDIDGWTEEYLKKKLTNLAEVIRNMNSNKGPDLLGVCEVERESVLEKLVKALEIEQRDYMVAHVDSPDPRGIDVAFIYDSNKFEKTDREFSHTILKRRATRDIYQITFETKPKKNAFVLMGNHWPSRSPNTYQTEPYRIMAAETLAYWNQRSQEKEPEAPILIMGDFNDGPGNRSMTDYALSTRSVKMVTRAREAPRLLNLMWPLLDEDYGSFYWNNTPFVFDQFLVSKGFLVKDRIFSVKPKTVQIIRPEKMREGDYEKPKRFGLPQKKNLNTEGYSDHFPISIIITEE